MLEREKEQKRPKETRHEGMTIARRDTHKMYTIQYYIHIQGAPAAVPVRWAHVLPPKNLESTVYNYGFPAR